MLADIPEKVRRLLIVDDEERLRFLFSMALEIDHYRIDEASSGKEAVKLLAEEQYDLVLLDLRMPGMSGLDVLKWMRSRGDSTRVFIVSAYIPRFAVLRGVACGVTTFLAKPMSLEFLRDVVRKGLENQNDKPLSLAHQKAAECRYKEAADQLKLSNSPLSEREEVWLELYDGAGDGKKFEEMAFLGSRLEKLVISG